MTSLDIDLLRAFVRVADTQSFTGAGEGLGATQSAVSVRVKKLEDRIGQRLLERTPRSVALTAFGARFLADARGLLKSHDDVLARALARERLVTVRLGVNEAAGTQHLTGVLTDLRHDFPDVRAEVRFGFSDDLVEALDDGQFDAVLVRRIVGAGGERRGTLIFTDDLAWHAAPGLDWRAPEPVPLVSIAPPCRFCALSTRVLDEAGLAWRLVFQSAGLSAVGAAVTAGLGIAVLGRGVRPPGTEMLGADHGLPPLPSSEIMLIIRSRDPEIRRILETISAGLARRAAG